MAKETEDIDLIPKVVEKGVQHFYERNNYYIVAEYYGDCRGVMGATIQYDITSMKKICWL